jgi:hypothetical protein
MRGKGEPGMGNEWVDDGVNAEAESLLLLARASGQAQGRAPGRREPEQRETGYSHRAGSDPAPVLPSPIFLDQIGAYRPSTRRPHDDPPDQRGRDRDFDLGYRQATGAVDRELDRG